MTTRGIASHRPAPVPAHVRSVAAELDLSEPMVRALAYLNVPRGQRRLGIVPGTESTWAALTRKRLVETGDLNDAGRAACARLFPAAPALPELADMPDWDSPAQPDHLADTVAEVES